MGNGKQVIPDPENEDILEDSASSEAAVLLHLPPQGTKRSLSPSGSDDSGGFGGSRKRYRGTTPSEHPSHINSAHQGSGAKEPPCPDPLKFTMKKGKDYRPYLNGCERYL